MKSFINQEKIFDTIQNTEFSSVDFKKVINKAVSLKGLDYKETAMLLACKEAEYLGMLFDAASRIKNMIYGRRLVFFAPLYISSFCVNNCLYCGFRKNNSKIHRKRLTYKEIEEEVRILESYGHKRLLVVAAEDDSIDADYLADVVGRIYAVKNGRGQIRRVNINSAPLEPEGFKKLKQSGIGTYQSFQETYHKQTYQYMHPSKGTGPKADYEKRLQSMDIAYKAGIDDLGIGVLFGLYDYRFEVLALIEHCRHLEDKFGVGPHTISVPRIEPASGSVVSFNPPHAVSDSDFKKLVAVLRLAVPYTGLILSTREGPMIRDELLNLGISQVSAGSRTSPGGYSNDGDGQFCLGDNRSLSEVVSNVSDRGFIASFCTACYRNQRTGENFMKLAKHGNIQEFCLPNALLTLKEYSLDYGNGDTSKISSLIRKELLNIKKLPIRQLTEDKMRLIEQGQRDLYF